MSGDGGENDALLHIEWPDRLRRGVYLALEANRVDLAQWRAREMDVHHICAAGLGGAAPGRRLLARWSVSVHSVVNAAIVPRAFHRAKGLHRHEFLHRVNMRLSSASMFAEAVVVHGGFSAGRLIMVQTLQTLGIELVAGSGDAVSLDLQRALQALLVRPAGGGAGGTGSNGGVRAASRRGRERVSSAGVEARVDSAVVPRARRSGIQLASAC